VLAYYDGDPDTLESTPVRQRAGDFHRRVHTALQTTGYGQRLSYTELAERAGNPRAARAAASACADNLIALFVPCHRALRADGSVGGFRYGLDLKRSLLDREKAGHAKIREA
jgi:methylated-DNA-[protein]-cysteine S-methyltransferase